MCSDEKIWSWQTCTRRLPISEFHGKLSDILELLGTDFYNSETREKGKAVKAVTALVGWGQRCWTEDQPGLLDQVMGSCAGGNRLTATCQSMWCRVVRTGDARCRPECATDYKGMNRRCSDANSASRSKQLKDKSTCLMRCFQEGAWQP